MIFAALEIVAADLHFLAGELVAGEAHLRLRVLDIFANSGQRWIDLFHRLDGAARFLLVLRHVADLPEIAQADDVLRVGRVFGATDRA